MSDNEVHFFHPRPGPRERHLKRRYRNPLFFDDAVVTQDEVIAARSADREDMDAFVKEVKRLFDQAANLPPNVESDVILGLKERCDQLYEQSCGFGIDLSREQQALKRLTEVIMKSVWQGAGNDMQARAELDQEETARAEHYRLLEHKLIVDLLSPESPIAEDHLVATLLSESETAVQHALRLFEPEHRAAMLSQASELLDQLQQRGLDIARWQERLALFGGRN